MNNSETPRVAVVMGSKSDWDVMQHASNILAEFQVPHESRVVSAHRTPERMVEFAKEAKARGVEIIIAGAGGAAHLPGMLAANTTLPVLGVPVARTSSMLRGIDALLAIVQMPRGIPVPTFAIGVPGAANAALSAVSILALHDDVLSTKLTDFRNQQAEASVQDVLL